MQSLPQRTGFGYAITVSGLRVTSAVDESAGQPPGNVYESKCAELSTENENY
jgi:hypothetical protein